MWKTLQICTRTGRFLYSLDFLVDQVGRLGESTRSPQTGNARSPRMARSNGGKAKAFFRAIPSGAFDQYLQDIQKLPLIKDPAEERRLARRVRRGDEKAAERRVTADLRFLL